MVRGGEADYTTLYISLKFKFTYIGDNFWQKIVILTDYFLELCVFQEKKSKNQKRKKSFKHNIENTYKLSLAAYYLHIRGIVTLTEGRERDIYRVL